MLQLTPFSPLLGTCSGVLEASQHVGVWGKEKRCPRSNDIPLSSLPIVALFLHPKGLQLLTSLCADHHQYACQKWFPVICHLLVVFANYATTRQMSITLHSICISHLKTPRVITKICAKLCKCTIPLILL